MRVFFLLGLCVFGQVTFIRLLNMFLLNINQMPGTILGAGEKALHKIGKVSILIDLDSREKVHSTMNKRKKNEELESCKFYD